MLKTWEPKRIRITDIAKEANVSQVTIYNYFGSKEALLKEVLKIISISPSASLKNI